MLLLVHFFVLLGVRVCTGCKAVMDGGLTIVAHLLESARPIRAVHRLRATTKVAGGWTVENVSAQDPDAVSVVVGWGKGTGATEDGGRPNAASSIILAFSIA